MKKYSLLFSFISHIFVYAEAFDGLTLFSPMENGFAKSYLINNNLDVINSWSHDYGPASMPYLLPDSTIIYPYRVANPTMIAGGVGGGIQAQTWNGEVLWDYTFSNSNYQHHHDIEPLPNGNILIIVWEAKTASEAYNMGRIEISNPLNQMWSSAILELNPTSGEIVWEWHLWDHLIQDIDSSLPNYGIISNHPELFDINCGEVGSPVGGPQQANADWMHFNSIHYNETLDQIILSSRAQNEIYIIDHSTTTEDASGHTGGNYGKGGDLLYRWGNPANYGRGTPDDNILVWQHSANWINSNYPGEGNIIIFNNNHFPGQDNHSAVIEITPPIDEDGNYLITDNNPYGPEHLTWIYTGDIQTPFQGGAFRLPNGNTIITQTHTSTIIEVNSSGQIEWTYEFVSENGPDVPTWIARCNKYAIDYFNSSTIGDLNNDNTLNILDIILLVNIILTADFNTQADLNQDGGCNILDVVILSNMILES